MNRVVKIAAIIAGIVLVGFIGRCAYMIVCISCTYPPIKAYEYAGSMDQFENEFNKFILSHQNMSYKISHRANNNYTTSDIVVESKSPAANIRYDLVVRKVNEITKVELIGVHDETHKTGGYRKGDAGVSDLFDGFKNDFLVRLEKDQHIILKPQFFNF